MRKYEIELAVGDTLLIGNEMLTILEIDGDEITFRVDEASACGPEESPFSQADTGRSRPR